MEKKKYYYKSKDEKTLLCFFSPLKTKKGIEAKDFVEITEEEYNNIKKSQ